MQTYAEGVNRKLKSLPRWAQVAILMLEALGVVAAVLLSVASGVMSNALLGWVGFPLTIAACLIGFGVIIWLASRLDK